MRTKEFLSKIDHARVIQAIRDAEAKTSGEIRVYIQRGKLKPDALEAAQKKFKNLEMDQTQERNAVLIYVAPRANKFAVVGDKAIHEKCGEEFWQRVVQTMGDCFRANRFTEGLHDAIRIIGDVLATYFPRKSPPDNELPDEVVEG